MGHLPKGVNALIGPAAAMDFDLHAGEFADTFFQLSLNGLPAGLDLPAGIVCPVVGDSNFITLHLL